MSLEHPFETFTGFVDEAIVFEDVLGSRSLYLRGWMLATSGPLESLNFALPPQPSITALLTFRADVAEQNPSLAHAAQSGFVVSLPLVDVSPEFQVSMWARLASGGEIQSTISVRPSWSSPTYKVVQVLQSQHTERAARNIPRIALESARAELVEVCRLRLEAFLETKSSLSFSSDPHPRLSIIIPTADEPHFTLSCLETLFALGISDMQVVVIDSGVAHETSELLSRIHNLTLLRAPRGTSFAQACNTGARHAQGLHLLFLNNDAFPSAGAIEAALLTARKVDAWGAVGAKLIRPDGLLQEVGCFILPNGRPVGRGHATESDLPAWNLALEVDYCSGAFLLTPRALFEKLGGFNEAFSPAYYEDVDYCARVTSAGYHCIVEPAAQVVHIERGTSEGAYDVERLMRKNCQLFLSLHPTFSGRSDASSHAGTAAPSDESGNAPTPDAAGTTESVRENTRTLCKRLDSQSTYAKPSVDGSTNILVIDDSIPDPTRGQGHARAALILETLHDLGLKVSLYPAHRDRRSSDTSWTYRGVQILTPEESESECDFLRRVIPRYDLLLVSRPHRMEHVQHAIRLLPRLTHIPPIIYDAEAVQSQREIVRLEVHRNQSLSREEIAGIISNELVFARDADQILTVSEREARIFTDFGFSQPTIVHHGVTPHPTTRSFTDRSHFLTVGPLLAPDTPNSDGVDWFMRAVHPQIVSSLQTSKVFLDCVGTCRVRSFEEQHSSGLRLLGQLANLYPAYNEHRVCIAPTRFSAGIPLKVIEAASYGVPSVVTPLLAEQLAWRDGVEILVGYDAKDFAAKCVALYSNQALWEDVRSAALARVQREYSVESCKKRLALVMQRYHRSSAGQRSENRRLPSDVQAGA